MPKLLSTKMPRGRRSKFPFDLQTYRRETAWLTTYRVYGVQNAVPVISYRHDDYLLESLRANKGQYGCRLKTVASPAFGFLVFTTSTVCLGIVEKSVFSKTTFRSLL